MEVSAAAPEEEEPLHIVWCHLNLRAAKFMKETFCLSETARKWDDDEESGTCSTEFYFYPAVHRIFLLLEYFWYCEVSDLILIDLIGLWANQEPQIFIFPGKKKKGKGDFWKKNDNNSKRKIKFLCSLFFSFFSKGIMIIWMTS